MVNFFKMIDLFLVSVLFIAGGCSAKRYAFTVNAPPKYSSEYIFNTVKIQHFESNKRNYGRSISNLIKGGIIDEGYIKVVEKNADGTLTGVLDIGKVHEYSNSKSYKCTKYENKKKYETTCHTYYYANKLAVNVEYILQDKHKNVVFADSITEVYDKTWSSSDSSSDAKSRALTEEEIINDTIRELSRKIVYAITPHKEIIERELQEGSDPNIKLGITYLVNGRLDQAVSIWDQCIKNTDSLEDRAAVYYNIGVVKESQGFYRDAFELYSKANSLLPTEELYIQSMTRTEVLNKKSGSLQKWNN